MLQHRTWGICETDAGKQVVTWSCGMIFQMSSAGGMLQGAAIPSHSSSMGVVHSVPHPYQAHSRPAYYAHHVRKEKVSVSLCSNFPDIMLPRSSGWQNRSRWILKWYIGGKCVSRVGKCERIWPMTARKRGGEHRTRPKPVWVRNSENWGSFQDSSPTGWGQVPSPYPCFCSCHCPVY